jgi:ketosteroid isomerase-like protein
MRGFPSRKNLPSLKARLTFFGVLLAVLSASCAPAVDTDAISKQLIQLDDNWSKAAATRNAETVASYYAADAIVYPPNVPMAVGQAAATKMWANAFADSSFTISWKTDHAGASKSGDMGFTAGAFEDSYKGPSGAMVHEKGKYVCVWSKQADGGWKAEHDIWNTDSR